MSETITTPLPVHEELAPPEQQQAEKLARYNAILAEQAVILPEVAENQEAIATSGAELIEEFGIKPELFEEPAKALFFTSIANRYAQLEAKKSGMSSSEYTADKEFIADATVLLIGENSTHFSEFKHLINTDDEVDPDKETKIYDKYTNVQVTAELKRAVEDGLLDGVKARLGITAENEDEYDIRVMNLTDEYTTHGMRAGMIDGLNEKPFSDPAWTEYYSDGDSFVTYENGLKAKAKEFQKDLGKTDKVPTAWVNSNNGKRTLCMPLPFAEKILYKDERRADYYTQDDYDRDFAIFEHEYTHTQGGLNLDQSIFFGISLEERRAELFSGDKNGYQDIKGALMDISAVTGIKFLDDMEGKVKGGGAAELYADIAGQIGLDSMLELALAPPKAYITESRPLQSEISSYLGGLDGVTKRIYERQLAAGKQSEVNTRLDKWAIRWSEIAPDTMDMVIGMRRSMYKLEFVTDMIAQRVNAIREKQPTPRTPEFENVEK